MSTPAGAATLISGAFQAAADGTLIFPPFPGLSLEYTMRPTFSTITQLAPDRSVTTIQLDPFPLWEYDLSFGHVSDDLHQGCTPIGPRNPMGYTALQHFLGIFCAVGGQRDTFMMKLSDITKRHSDSRVKNIIIGTGDGTTTSFQLVRSVGGFLDLIDNPILDTLTVTVGKDAAIAAVTPTSVVNGLVTLGAPPEPGSTVFASFDWLHRMRFTKDEEEFDAVCYQLYSRGSLKLTQDRNQTT